MSDKIREAQQKARTFARRSTTSSTAKAYVLGLCDLLDAALAQQPAPVAVPDDLKAEVAWCLAEGNIGPRTRKLIERLHSAFSASAAPAALGVDGCGKPLCGSIEFAGGHHPLCPNAAPPAAEQPHSTTSDRYRAELYDEVWEKARDMGYGNVTEALVSLERMKAGGGKA